MTEQYSYFGGVEGGASNSTFILVRSDGTTLATYQGEGTNQYLIGMEECLRRINDLVTKGLKSAGLKEGTKLEGLGMSLSGGDEINIQDAIKAAVSKDYPGLTSSVFVGSDTQSVLATALPEGGVVMIAGTGSNCQLINPDGTMGRCGGWGHMIGDEASACWISLRAIKTFFDAEDNLVPCPYSTDVVRDCMYKYYNVKNRAGMLDHLYSNFDKAKFSGFCRELAVAATETGDELCRDLFRAAGRLVARHLYGISQSISKDLKTRDGGLPVVCQGSVFKSWNLLEEGFVEEMKANLATTDIQEVTLLRLECEACIGAAVLGAKAAGKELPLDFKANSSVLFHGKF